jgi:microcystin-dependent protein
MPRNSSGTYSIPIAAFVPGGLIKSSDDNTNFSDIALALTQSLATTGVSTMTGPINASAGLVTAPGYTFSGAPKTGFFLAGANQIGWAANGVQGATLNSDTSTTWAGGATFGGPVSATQGTIPIGGMMDFAGATAPSGWLLCFGQQVSTTTYAALFAVIGSSYGSGAGTFGIPDCRGRATFGKDNMGGSAAGRITGTLNYDGTVLGEAGGNQGQTLTASQVPTITSTASVSVVGGSLPGGSFPVTNGSAAAASFNNGSVQTTIAFAAGTAVWSLYSTLGGTATSNNTGGQAFSILNPSIIITKIIYCGI